MIKQAPTRAPQKREAEGKVARGSSAGTPSPGGIQAVADHAGVSIATVSRVLNGIKSKANETTEARVRLAADHLGYRPAHAGRALRLRQTKLVALLIPDISNAFYAAIARSIEGSLRDRDHTMILCNTSEDPQLQDFYLEEMQAYHVRGIALLGAVDSPRLTSALANGLPIAFVNRKPPRGGGGLCRHRQYRRGAGRRIAFSIAGLLGLRRDPRPVALVGEPGAF